MIRKVAIHSAPRSGSTWLGQIFNSHPDVAYRFQPLFSFAFKDQLSEKSSLTEINQFYEDLLESQDKFLLQIEEESMSGRSLYFEKSLNPTHIAYKEVRYHHILENLLQKDPDIIVIGLVRNPLAVISSWLKSPREFRTDLGWGMMDQWRSASEKNRGRVEEYYGFDKWKETSLLFLKLSEKYPENFYLLKYNDLLVDAVLHISDLFSFCGLEMKKSTLSFIKESRNKNDEGEYSVFKSHIIDNEWEKQLDHRIVEEVNKELFNTELEQFIR